MLGHVLFLGEGKAREGGIPPTGLFVGGVTGRPQKVLSLMISSLSTDPDSN